MTIFVHCDPGARMTIEANLWPEEIVQYMNELMSMRPQNKHNNNYYYNELAMGILCVWYSDVWVPDRPTDRPTNVSICLNIYRNR